MKKLSARLLRSLVTLLALCGLAAGVLLLFSPIPVGILIFALSLSVLIYVNDGATRLVSEIRRDYQSLNTRLHWAEEKLARRARFISDALNRTRPELQSDAE